MKIRTSFPSAILFLSMLLSGCLAAQSAGSEQSPTSSPMSGFQIGDPTSIPPGAEITDADFQAGVTAYRQRDFTAVRELMEKVIARSPQLAPPHWYLGRAYYEAGDYEAALDQMQQALAIDPYYALAYADRGLVNFALGNEEHGLIDYRHALELDPSLAKVHHNLGAYYFNHGRLEESLQEFELAVRIDPTRSVSWRSRSEVLLELGRFEECVQSSDSAIDADETNGLAYIIRGRCQGEIGNSEQALADILWATSNNPKDGDIIFEACYGFLQIKAYDEAIEYCTDAIAIDPTDHKALINRGVAYFNTDRYLEARDDFSRALELGEIPVAYHNRGNAYMKLGQYQAAVDDYKKALALYPTGDVYYSLGFAYTQLGDYQNALAAFEQGDTFGPQELSEKIVLWGKAQVYDRSGEVDMAFELYTQLIDQYQFLEAYYFRGVIYESKGMTTEAIQDYQSFLELVQNEPDDSSAQIFILDAAQRIEDLDK